MGILCLFHPIFRGGLSNTEFERLLLLFFPLFDYGCYSRDCFLERRRWFFMARNGSECFSGQRKDIPRFFLCYPYGGVRAQEMASMISICHGPAN